MKKLVILLIALFCLTQTQAQTDTVNTQTNTLSTEQLQEGTLSYVVYLQDTTGAKFKTEIWDRTLSKTEEVYTLRWTRHTDSKQAFHNYTITFDEQLRPLEERVHSQTAKGIEKKHFIYGENTLSSNTDTTAHTAAPVQMEDLKHSFNWELDMETLAALPLGAEKAFAISFYHPGSKTPPKYYTYRVDRSEELLVNDQKIDCWVLKVVYSERQQSEFWVAKASHRVLQMKEEFYGMFRFKKLIL